jgi:hypothetical protein
MLCAQSAHAQSIFTSQTPDLQNLTDGVNYELGTKWKASVGGFVTHVRYWKAVGDTSGTHTGRIWSGTTVLANVTFTGETASGWQQQALPSPLLITAGTEYLVTVNTSAKFYAASNAGLQAAVVNGPVSAIMAGGVYGPACTTTACPRPTTVYQSSNYFRDIVFATGAPAPAPPPPAPAPAPAPSPAPAPAPVPPPAPCQCPPVTTTGQAVLSWTPPSVVGTGYRIYFGNSPGVYSQPYGSGILVPSGGSTTYTVTGLQSGKNYCFVATTVDSRIPGESAYSNEACKVIP